MAKRKKYNNPNQTSILPLFDAEDMMNDIKDLVIHNIIEKGRSATGRTIDKLKVIKISDDEFQILTPYYLKYLETGRPPSKAKGRQPIGKGKLVAKPVTVLAYRLQDGWLQARGLPLESAFPIAQSIMSKGDRTFRNGGEDVWTSDLNAFIANNMDQYLNVEQYINIENL